MRCRPRCPREFAPRIAAYWPAITAAMLAPGYSGVRPKTGGPAKSRCRISASKARRSHGLPGLVNLFGIESPA